MFYVSGVNKNLVGITDTDDNIEEWYTKEQVLQFIVEYNMVIKGAENTARGLQVNVTSPQIAEIEEYEIGTPFELHKNDEIFYFIKMGNIGYEAFRVYDTKFNFTTLQRSFLLSDKDMVVCRCNNVVWFQDFKNWFKKHQPMTCERLYK